MILFYNILIFDFPIHCHPHHNTCHHLNHCQFFVSSPSSLFSLATNNIICIESYKITIIILIKTSDIYTTHLYSFKDNANQPVSQPVSYLSPHSFHQQSIWIIPHSIRAFHFGYKYNDCLISWYHYAVWKRISFPSQFLIGWMKFI